MASDSTAKLAGSWGDGPDAGRELPGTQVLDGPHLSCRRTVSPLESENRDTPLEV